MTRGDALRLFWRAFRRAPKGALAAAGWYVVGKRLRAKKRIKVLAGRPRRRGYALWLAENDRPRWADVPSRTTDLASWPARPQVSLVVLPGNDAVSVAASAESVATQLYPPLEILVLTRTSGEGASARSISLSPRIRSLAPKGARIVPVTTDGLGHAVDAAIVAARGDVVAFLRPGDLLHPEALYEVARLLAWRGDLRAVYTDEDLLDADGSRYRPKLKPDFNEDYALGIDFVGSLLAVRRDLFERIGGLGACEPGIEFTHLVLKVSSAFGEAAIGHIPRILYHRRHVRRRGRAAPPPVDAAARKRMVESHLAARQVDAVVVVNARSGVTRIRRPVPRPRPLVSVIIPSRDGLRFLRPCIDSLLHRTAYAALEILVVDNGSVRPKTLAYLERIARNRRVRILPMPGPFNYSRLNNRAAAEARGSVLALLNNDIEVISENWLSEMVSNAVRPEVGAVGARLLYADGRIQHGGVILGVGGIAGHAHRFFPASHRGYMYRLQVAHRLSAVTAACLVVEARKFHEIGGFDEEVFPVTLNDVDLCLRLDAAGYRTLWTPHAALYHKESATRRRDHRRDQSARWQKEMAAFKERWKHIIDDDPFYNPNLTRAAEDFSLR